jgi:hypothetical protein
VQATLYLSGRKRALTIFPKIDMSDMSMEALCQVLHTRLARFGIPVCVRGNKPEGGFSMSHGTNGLGCASRENRWVTCELIAQQVQAFHTKAAERTAVLAKAEALRTEMEHVQEEAFDLLAQLQEQDIDSKHE